MKRIVISLPARRGRLGLEVDAFALESESRLVQRDVVGQAAHAGAVIKFQDGLSFLKVCTLGPESAQITITRQSLNGQGKKLESRIKPYPHEGSFALSSNCLGFEAG
jgi:hypothetical protein